MPSSLWDASDAENKAAEEERLRKEKADAMLQAHLEREAAERAAGRKDWDDEVTAPEYEIDTSDELDPEAEKAAHKLRELKRIRRERFTDRRAREGAGGDRAAAQSHC